MNTEETLARVPSSVLDEDRKTAELAEQRATSFIVRNQTDAEQAGALIQLIKEKRAEIEAKRTKLTKPLHEAWKEANALFKPIDMQLDKARKALGKALALYLKEQEEQQAKAFQEAAQAHVAGDDQTARAALAVANDAAAATRKPAGVGSVRWKWVAKVIDANAVPREWCTPDEKRIQANARATPSDTEPTPIPGVQYVKESVVSASARRKESGK